MRILLAIESFKDGLRLIESVPTIKTGETRLLILTCVEPCDFDDFCSSIYGYDTQHEILSRRVLAAERDALNLQRYVMKKYPLAHVEMQVVIGKPKSVIVETAKSWQADAILLGSHRRRGVEKLLLGSVSEAVAIEAPCTVAVIK